MRWHGVRAVPDAGPCCAAPDEAVVEAVGLSMTYPSGTEALRDVSFSVERGSIVGYLGPNGSGKSTTVHILTTALAPTGGTACVCGYDIRSARSKVRARVGFATQDVCLDWLVTTEDNLWFYGRMQGIGRSELRASISRLLSDFELEEKRNAPAWSLSGGQSRRLQLSMTLLRRPEVLFVDEPTLGLDPLGKRTLFQRLAELPTSGTTIFYSSNEMHELEKLCTHVIFIDRGEVIASGPLAQFVSEHSNGTTVEVVCGAPPTDDALAALETRWSIRLLSTTPLRWISWGPRSTFAEAISWLATQGTDIRDIKVREPSLEDAFIELVRRRGNASRGGTR